MFKHNRFLTFFLVASVTYAGSASARYVQADPIGLDGGINAYLYGDAAPTMNIDPEGLMGQGSGANANRGQTVWPNRGSGRAAVDYCSVSVSGPGISYGVTISGSGKVYLNVGTGNVTPLPSVQLVYGRMNGPATSADVDNFLQGGGGQISYGQYGVGAGTAFSGGRTATQITIGTPQLPSGGGGYSVPIVDLLRK